MKFLEMMILILLILLVSTGCTKGQDFAAETVEEFFQAIIEKNESLFLSKVCENYTSTAMIDFNTFAFVKTNIENFSCETIGEDVIGLQVNCQGTITANFADEIRSFDLSNRIYQLTEESGTWLVCGHTDSP